MKEVQKFSVKKLLLTIFCSVLVTVFIGSTIVFIEDVISYLFGEKIGVIELQAEQGDSSLEELFESSQNYYDIFKKGVEKSREKYVESLGEEYANSIPVEGIFLQRLILEIGIETKIKIYVLSVLYGIVLGTAVYIIAVQNVKKQQLIKELILALLIIGLFIVMVNIIVKKLIFNKIIGINDYHEYNLYDVRSDSIILISTGILFIVYIINIIRQKRITNELNRELNN